ncbi:single cache domain-containing protein [Aquabacterium commune]|uniref:Single cache domain-containing protein n=1 Tax=Aquabacterium commune TaxID=70586 RepID=A0A4R6R4R2_9BURK|nr:cache domain-containing protein [Aquabacterium commune]TDP80752.1 single cache domain-containing protein [Aquabacterium commune]
MTVVSRRFAIAALTAIAASAWSPLSWAGDRATKEEAVAMVKKAIAQYKANGKDKTFAEINAKNPMFFDRDLYVYVATLDGIDVAHAANPKLVGKNLAQLKDADGVPFVEHIIAMAKSGKPGWVDYKWPNPVSKQIDEKTTYVEAFDGHAFCAGVYR